MEINFRGLAELVSASAESLGKLAESIARVLRLSLAGLDEVRARRDHARLKILYMDLCSYIADQTGTVWVLVEYQNLYNDGANERALEATWAKYTEMVADLMTELQPITVQWKKERSNFVLTTAYRDLMDGLAARTALLEQANQAVRPTTEEEVESLNELSRKWYQLRQDLNCAIHYLGRHLADVKSPAQEIDSTVPETNVDQRYPAFKSTRPN